MKQTTDIHRHSLEALIHIICWGLFFAFPLFFVQRTNGTIDWDAFFHHSLFPASTFIIFYLNYFVLIPHILFHEHTKRFLLINFLIIICMTFSLRYLNNLFNPPPADFNRPLPPQFIFYLRDMSGLIFSAGLSVAIRMSLRWNQDKAAQREALKSLTEAELKNLRNQLNPHFLLNTLNNIYAYCGMSSTITSRCLSRWQKKSISSKTISS